MLKKKWILSTFFYFIKFFLGAVSTFWISLFLVQMELFLGAISLFNSLTITGYFYKLQGHFISYSVLNKYVSRDDLKIEEDNQLFEKGR